MAQTQQVEIKKSGSMGSFVFMGAVVCFLAYVITKNVFIPKSVMLAFTVLGAIYLFFKGMKQPEIVTYVLVAYIPFSAELAGDFGGFATAVNFTNLLMIFIMVVWLTGRYASDEPIWLSTPLNLPIILFLLVGLISVIRGINFSGGHLVAAIIEYKRWITPPLLYFLVLNTVKNRPTIRAIINIMMFVTAIVACMAIYDYIDAGEGGSLESSRIGGIVDQPNMLAAFFNYYMFLPLAFMLMNTKKSKYWLFLIPVLLEFRGVMVTFSRGGYMAFALGLYAISFFRSKMLFVFLILVGFIVYFNPILLPAGVRYRMGQTFQIDKTSAQEVEYDEASLESSAKSRVEIWRASVDMIKDHPVFGVGYKLFPYMLEYYAPQWKGFDAHNTYIIITAEMGIPALLIFLWCILSILWQTLRLYRRR